MCGVLETHKSAQSLLVNIFEEYAKYLKGNFEDAAGALANISAYYSAKSVYPFLSEKNRGQI
jgi:hypothetical protein